MLNYEDTPFFLIHSLSLSPERAIMTHHEHSASAIVSASTLLPTVDVIPVPTTDRKKSARGGFTNLPFAGCSAILENRKNFSGMRAVAVLEYGRFGQDRGLGYINIATNMDELDASRSGTCRRSVLKMLVPRRAGRQQAWPTAQIPQLNERKNASPGRSYRSSNLI